MHIRAPLRSSSDPFSSLSRHFGLSLCSRRGWEGEPVVKFYVSTILHWPSRQLTCFLSYSSPLWVTLIHTCTHLQHRESLINLWHFALTQATNLTVSSECLPHLPPPLQSLLLPQSVISFPMETIERSWNICIFQIRLFFSSFQPFSSSFFSRTILVVSWKQALVLLLLSPATHQEGKTRSIAPTILCC